MIEASIIYRYPDNRARDLYIEAVFAHAADHLHVYSNDDSPLEPLADGLQINVDDVPLHLADHFLRPIKT